MFRVEPLELSPQARRLRNSSASRNNLLDLLLLLCLMLMMLMLLLLVVVVLAHTHTNSS